MPSPHSLPGSDGDVNKKMTAGKSNETATMKSTEAPTTKYHGLGIRHVQMMSMSFCMIALLMARSSLGVAILAMTNTANKNNSTVEVYDWNKKTQGLILSSFFWGYMSMQIPAGLLARRFGGKPILLFSLLANGCLTAIFPILAKLGGWPVVCVVRVAMGLTQACLFPASHTLLGKWLPTNERTTGTGIVYTGPQIGTIIAMPLSGYLAETALGWKMIFYVISAVMFLTAGIWYWFAASSPSTHPMISEEERNYIEMSLNSVESRATQSTPWKEMLRTGPLWAIVAAHVGGSWIYMLFFVELPTYLEMAMQISLRNSATLSALPYVGMGLGNIIAASICEWIYNRGYLSLTNARKLFNSIALFGGGLGIIGLAFLGPNNKYIAIALIIFVLTAYGCTAAGFMVNHLDLSPQFAGVMLAITNFSGTVGSIFTPVVNSFILGNDLTDISRWRMVFLLAGGMAIGANIIYIIFGSSDRQPWDNPHYKSRRKTIAEELKPLDRKQLKELEALKSSIESC